MNSNKKLQLDYFAVLMPRTYFKTHPDGPRRIRRAKRRKKI